MLFRKILFSFIFMAVIFVSSLTAGGTELNKPKDMERILMRIYFTPFTSETYVPLTMEEIEERCTYMIWFIKEHPSTRLKEHPFVLKLKNLFGLKSTNVQIDNLLIRLKVILGDEIFFVDKNGVVLNKSTERTFSLSKTQRMEIQEEIINYSGVIDVRTSKDIGLIK